MSHYLRITVTLNTLPKTTSRASSQDLQEI